MGYIYTATSPNDSRSGKTLLGKSAAVAMAAIVYEIREGLGLPAGYLENSHILPAGEPAQPIHRELCRRMTLLREERREAALSPGDDEQFVIWTKVRDRGAKLAGVTVCFLLGRSYCSISHSGETIALPADPYAEGIAAGHEDLNHEFSYRPERNPYHSHPAYARSWETGYDHGHSDAECVYEHQLND